MNTDEKTNKTQLKSIQNKLLDQVAKLCQEAEEELKAINGGG